MKTPGCMDYCKANLLRDDGHDTKYKDTGVIANAQSVGTHMEDNGHPLLYDKQSGDLIPQNPLLALNGIPPAPESKPLSHEFVDKLQVDKSVLDDVKNDARHDHGISEYFKEHLKALADSFTKAKINQILNEPVAKVLGFSTTSTTVKCSFCTSSGRLARSGWTCASGTYGSCRASYGYFSCG